MMEKDEKIYESKITHIFDKNVILAITISILITYFMGGNISYIIIGIIVLLSLYILTFKKIRIVVRNNELVYSYKQNNEIQGSRVTGFMDADSFSNWIEKLL